MCGIVGYIGDKDATPIILNGLKELEYRGYDSAGIAVLQNGRIEIRRDAGKLSRLEALVAVEPISGKLGIGHTRWATHGEPTRETLTPISVQVVRLWLFIMELSRIFSNCGKN